MPRTFPALLCAVLLACTLAAGAGRADRSAPSPAVRPRAPAQHARRFAPGACEELVLAAADRQGGPLAARNGSQRCADRPAARASARDNRSLGAPTSFSRRRLCRRAATPTPIYRLTFGDGSKMDYYFGVDNQGKVRRPCA